MQRASLLISEIDGSCVALWDRELPVIPENFPSLKITPWGTLKTLVDEFARFLDWSEADYLDEAESDWRKELAQAVSPHYTLARAHDDSTAPAKIRDELEKYLDEYPTNSPGVLQHMSALIIRSVEEEHPPPDNAEALVDVMVRRISELISLFSTDCHPGVEEALPPDGAVLSPSLVLSDDSDSPPNVFKRLGQSWRVRYDGNPSKLISHRLGMSYIHELLLRPCDPIGAEVLAVLARKQP